jgi:hypothetical protein
MATIIDNKKVVRRAIIFHKVHLNFHELGVRGARRNDPGLGMKTVAGIEKST